MQQTNYNGYPGPGATTSQSFPEVLASTAGQIKLNGGVLLAQGFGVLAKGRVLGKITASGKYAPYASTTLTAAAALNATSITVSDASAFVVGDNIVVGTASAIAITAFNGNTITLASPGLSAAQSSGAAVNTNDGRQTAACILDNTADTTSNDVGASAWIGGYFISSACAGLDSNAKTSLKNAGLFIFS